MNNDEQTLLDDLFKGIDQEKLSQLTDDDKQLIQENLISLISLSIAASNEPTEGYEPTKEEEPKEEDDKYHNLIVEKRKLSQTISKAKEFMSKLSKEISDYSNKI